MVRCFGAAAKSRAQPYNKKHSHPSTLVDDKFDYVERIVTLIALSAFYQSWHNSKLSILPSAKTTHYYRQIASLKSQKFQVWSACTYETKFRMIIKIFGPLGVAIARRNRVENFFFSFSLNHWSLASKYLVFASC